MPEVNEHGQPVGDVVPGWGERRPAVALTLVGRHVTLEPLDVTHAPALYDALCGPDDAPLWTYRPTGPPSDQVAMTAFVQAQLDARPALQTFALVPAGEPAAGIASYTRIDPGAGQVELAGVLFSRRLQRSTAATEAVHLAMAHAFDDLGYRRFEWKCDALNEPSRRAATRLGFRYEGRFRQHLVIKGRNRDTDWFSVTDAQWPAVRAAHRCWLAPENFDAAGRQRTALSELTRPGR